MRFFVVDDDDVWFSLFANYEFSGCSHAIFQDLTVALRAKRLQEFPRVRGQREATTSRLTVAAQRGILMWLANRRPVHQLETRLTAPHRALLYTACSQQDTIKKEVPKHISAPSPPHRHGLSPLRSSDHRRETKSSK